MNAKELREKLSSWTFETEGRQSLSTVCDGWTVQVTADDNNRIAGLVWETALTRSGEPPVGRTAKHWGEAIAKSASGLTERLRLLEADAERNEALLRSDEPSRLGDEASYFEVRLQGESNATVRRFTADTKAGTPRQQVAYAITHETLAKLAADIAS